MKTQTAYKRMREWFTRPNAKLAQSPGGTCYYRRHMEPTSRERCAVGCLIKNKDYDPSWEGSTATYFPMPKYLKTIDSKFLIEAQTAHDSASTPAGFVKSLDAIARRHGLEVITD